MEQVPVPEGVCTEPLSPGLAYLWVTKVTGTANATHLGSVAFYAELCVFGLLTDPGAPPPGNGIGMGWNGVETWTAANGDQLRGMERLIGFTAPPGTPGFMFIVTLSFLDGGTGRFAHAMGEATGLLDPAAQSVVFDGWIRYGKKGE
jgi:hypothetical protein